MVAAQTPPLPPPWAVLGGVFPPLGRSRPPGASVPRVADRDLGLAEPGMNQAPLFKNMIYQFQQKMRKMKRKQPNGKEKTITWEKEKEKGKGKRKKRKDKVITLSFRFFIFL